MRVQYMFQSLIGRLKTLSEAKRSHVGRSFQSLIGRLKTIFLLWVLLWRFRLFQSLIGRLKTVTVFIAATTSDAEFQSLIGRLKTTARVRFYTSGASFNPS